MTVRPFSESDMDTAYELWRRTLGDLWSLSLEAFRHKIGGHPEHEAAMHFVACEGEKVVGFVATQIPVGLGGGERAGLMCLLVSPDWQRKGIGRELVEHALAALKGRGVSEVQLGAGGLSYFWPGVPANLPDALGFFRACGWPETHSMFDLVADISTYRTPPEVYERKRRPDVEIMIASAGDIRTVLDFESRHFPRWLPHYRKLVEHGAFSDVVIARDRNTGRVLGVSSAIDGRRE